jgi:hypothetical protein
MTFWARIMARLALTAGICLFTFGYAKCVFVGTSDPAGTGGGYVTGGGMPPNGAGPPSGAGTFTTTLLLRDSTGLVATNFRFGESIRFELEARNRTAQTVNLVFPDAQIYDFVVLDAGSNRLRWRWSDGMAFAQVTTELTFDPYSSKSYNVVWNGVLSNGTQLPPGSYRARGTLVFDEFASDPLAPNEMASPLVDFTVR